MSLETPEILDEFGSWWLSERGTPALHLNEPTWIIDGFNGLIVDFLSALVLFLDSSQPQPLKCPKQIIFFLHQTNKCMINTMTMSNQAQASTTAASTY